MSAAYKNYNMYAEPVVLTQFLLRYVFVAFNELSLAFGLSGSTIRPIDCASELFEFHVYRSPIVCRVHGISRTLCYRRVDHSPGSDVRCYGKCG